MAAEETNKATAQPTAKSGSGVSISTGSSKPAFANDSTRFFDFFGLPRELRGKIYEQPVLFEYEHLPMSSDADLITKAKKLRTSLLSVSRQFRDEKTKDVLDSRFFACEIMIGPMATGPFHRRETKPNLAYRVLHRE